MEVFPNVYIGSPLIFEVKYPVVKSSGHAKERRRLLHDRQIRIVELHHKNMTKAESEQLERFFIDRKGGFEPFVFFYPTKRFWYDEFIGIGDGSKTSFSLRAKDPESLKVYIDDSQTTSYSISSGSGQYGEDVIDFTDAPASGSVITVDFFGTLMLYMRFDLESLDRSATSYANYNAVTRLKEVWQ